MAFRLPPLSSLRVFEAAARHHSFRKAADELNLTASAVSHGVQTLENWLGVELFSRASRGLRLTGAGEIYAPLVNQALSVLATATEQLPGRKATGTLSLSCAPSFATKILLPRLAKFNAQFPDVSVTIDTSHRLVDLALDDFDLAIRYSANEKPAANWTFLAAETLLPVCSPDLKRRLGLSADPRFVSQAPLIHLTSVSVDWGYWFRANGMEPPKSIDNGLSVDTMQMAFEAAMRGLGVVLGRRPIVDDDIESGRLLALGSEALPSGCGYWLVTSETDFPRPEVKQFRRWLLLELGVESAPRKLERLAVRKAPVTHHPKQATKPARMVSKNTATP
jgi:LysR family transcriptional regulator, glycine cleavage system transcriptional activator